MAPLMIIGTVPLYNVAAVLILSFTAPDNKNFSMDAFKNAFAVPGVAIAAGAGLMAIGAAISSGAQKLSQGSLSGGASTAYTGGSPSGADVASYESTLTVEVIGKLSGSDILLAGSNQQKKWNR